VLEELRDERPDLVEKREVYIDGGVTRGTDVLKALCLGARGVGLGRAFLYGNALWGERGCSRVIESKHCPKYCVWRRLMLASHARGDRDRDAAGGRAAIGRAPAGAGAECWGQSCGGEAVRTPEKCVVGVDD
jgi:hypothetical protein